MKLARTVCSFASDLRELHVSDKVCYKLRRMALSACAVFFFLIFIVSTTLATQTRKSPPAAAPPTPPASSANSVSAGAKLTFRRVFESSTPEFIEITVRENSDDATYEIRQLDEEAGTAPFVVSSGLRAAMFDLAGQLHHFRGENLDVHRKIANLGEKTFRWEQNKDAYEVKFNYTLNSTANKLLQIFEGLARQQELLVLLQRRMKYDRLGINDALLQFETDLNRKLLPEPQRALPTLDAIAGDSKFVDIGRQRARALAERIRRQS
ncbi:MAG TPA: hypothetical protein VGI16_09425 [Candidatus Acidoferrum sp.]|jgi:hypothetical protein